MMINFDAKRSHFAQYHSSFHYNQLHSDTGGLDCPWFAQEINELFHFYEVVKNYAKLLDFNALLLKQSQQRANKTARGKAKKNEKNQTKSLKNDDWIIKKNKPH